ncbi:MAG: condensation domain-containing protein, partial [Solirubrobacteraceae bacterium]
MTLTKLLSLLQSKGMALSLSGDDLSVRGIEDALSDGELIASLREHKKALVALLKSGAPIGAGAPVPPNLIPEGATHIAPDMLPLVSLDQDAIDAIVARVPGGAANVADIYPLTPLQEGMLFHHLWSSDADAYTEGYLLAFPSRARVDRFVAALKRVIARHDILRTSIAWEGLPSPVQVVHRRAELPFEIVDVGADADAAAELERRTGAQHRLDLAVAPLMRCHAACDERGGRWLLSVVFHHLAIDHTALALLIDETRAIEHGRFDQLPPAVPFRNFVAQARFGVSQDEHDAFFGKMLGDIDET